jgi:hypothetical protein
MLRPEDLTGAFADIWATDRRVVSQSENVVFVGFCWQSASASGCLKGYTPAG